MSFSHYLEGDSGSKLYQPKDEVESQYSQTEKKTGKKSVPTTPSWRKPDPSQWKYQD